MSKLSDTLQAVRDENLTKEQLEKYFDLLTTYFVDIKLETADLEKKSALFIHRVRQDGFSMESCKNEWKCTTEGQRLIELKHFATIVNAQLRSIKNRIYAKLS